MDLPRESVASSETALRQIVLYSGCCCGKTERGFEPAHAAQALLQPADVLHL